MYNGSRPNHPQIHLVFQDYETSARLIRATQRSRPIDDASTNRIRRPRSDRNFISKPGEGPNGKNRVGPISPRTTESGGEQPEMGLLSKNFAAALLGAAGPAPAEASDSKNIPPVAVEGERVVIPGEAPEKQEQQVGRLDKKFSAAEGNHDNRSAAMRQLDSDACHAALARYTSNKEIEDRIEESATQSQGEKTNEAGDDETGARKGAIGNK